MLEFFETCCFDASWIDLYALRPPVHKAAVIDRGYCGGCHPGFVYLPFILPCCRLGLSDEIAYWTKTDVVR